MKTMTRREQVLERLRAAGGDWVNGPELANEVVGGSEGLKRLRELRADGYKIEEGKHPDPFRSIWQYRLIGYGPRIPVEPSPQPVPTAPQPSTYRCTVRDKQGVPCDGELAPVKPSGISDSYVTGRCRIHGWVPVKV